MREIILLFVLGIMTFILSACSNGNAFSSLKQSPSNASSTVVTNNKNSKEANSSSTSDSANNITDKANSKKILIAYFSRTGENYNVGNIEKGNTQIIAEMISEQTDGTLFRIQTVNPYPEDYMECTKIAQKEKDDDARPELVNNVDNMNNYDVIFLGYPIWWGDMPMAVYTFMENYDFSGKTIVPFCTNEGSGLSDTVDNIKKACPDSSVLDGLAIQGMIAQESRDKAKKAVTDWLKQNDF